MNIVREGMQISMSEKVKPMTEDDGGGRDPSSYFNSGKNPTPPGKNVSGDKSVTGMKCVNF